MAAGYSTRRALLCCAPLLLAWRAHATETAASAWTQLKTSIRKRYPDAIHISVPELAAWLADKQRTPPLLLDVRSAAEFADGHLAGAIRAETLAQAKAALLGVPRNRPVVLYCAVGMRSSKLATELQSLGRTPVFNLEGSAFEWVNAGHTLVSSAGPTDKTHPYDREWGQFLDREHWSRQP